MVPKFTDEQLDREVLYILKQHVGKGNAIARFDMVAMIYGSEAALNQNDDNQWDREIRYSVARLRHEYFVCDLGDGNGRYLAANESEFLEFYSYFIAPIRPKAELAKVMMKNARHTWPNVLQPSLFDFNELEMA